jgi:hypothetical protein
MAVAVMALGATAVSTATAAPAKSSYHFSAVTAAGCANTRAYTINDKGEYGGVSYCHGASQGFIVRHGHTTLIRVPGSKKQDTSVSTVANNGTAAVSAYKRKYKLPLVAYIRSAHGKMTKVSDPKAGRGGTSINGLNSHGVAVGAYSVGGPKSSVQAFIDKKGKFTDFDAKQPTATSTILTGINDKGGMSGVWIDPGQITHSFLVSPGGKITPVHLSGAGKAAGDGVSVSTIASNGAFVADVVRNGKTHGCFVHHGKRTNITYPKLGKNYTDVEGVNRHGVVMGTYYGTDNLAHGFLARSK